jgi:hypothetical protein
MATLDIILNAMMVGIGSGIGSAIGSYIATKAVINNAEKIGKIANVLRNNKKAR